MLGLQFRAKAKSHSYPNTGLGSNRLQPITWLVHCQLQKWHWLLKRWIKNNMLVKKKVGLWIDINYLDQWRIKHANMSFKHFKAMSVAITHVQVTICANLQPAIPEMCYLKHSKTCRECRIWIMEHVVPELLTVFEQCNDGWRPHRAPTHQYQRAPSEGLKWLQCVNMISRG